MKKKNVYLSLFAVFLGLWLFPAFVASADENAPILPGEVILNELMWMGSSSVSGDEWVEMKNMTSRDISLSGCKLVKKDGKEIAKNPDFPSLTVPAGGFLVISYKSPEDSIINVSSSKILSYLGLSNTDLAVSLLCSNALIDAAGDGGAPLAGENGAVKKSMERNATPGDGTKKENWHTAFFAANLDLGAVDLATPGAANSFEAPPPGGGGGDDSGETGEDENGETPPEYSQGMKFNEVFPYPPSGGNEFVELKNTDSLPVDIAGWKIRDSAGHEIALAPGLPIASGDLFFVEGNLYLNNSGEEKLVLVSPDGKEVDTVSYSNPDESASRSWDGSAWRWSKTATPGAANSFEAPPPGGGGDDDEEEPEIFNVKLNELYPYPSTGEEEFVEVKNMGDLAVDLKGWKIRDGAGHEKEITDASLVEPEEVFVFRGNFYLNNSGEDKVALIDPAGNVADEIVYTNADEGRSFAFDGSIWVWSPLPTPGEANRFEEAPEDEDLDGKEIILNEILPNPEKDEELNEYIEIKNIGEKEINLKNWILKDGSKAGKYVFKEDTPIGAGKFLVVYRSVFRFALNNSGNESVILESPGGKVVSETSYDKADDGVSFNFDGLSWRWSRFLTPEKDNRFNNLPKIDIKIDKEVYTNVFAQFEIRAKDKDKDKTKAVWDFGDGHKSYLKKVRHKFEKDGKFDVSVTVSDGSEKVMKKIRLQVQDFPKSKIEISSLCPNPAGKDSENEWLVIRNDSGHKLNLKGWSLATGALKLFNHPIREDFFVKPGEEKKLTRKESLFSLPNKKGMIELRYPNGKKAFGVDYEKEKIGEDDVYEKVAGVWQWKLASPEKPQPVALANNQPSENEFQAEDWLGKFSRKNDPSAFWKILATDNWKFALPEKIFSPKKIILGETSYENIVDYYAWSGETHEPHWALILPQKINIFINLLLGKMI